MYTPDISIVVVPDWYLLFTLIPFVVAWLKIGVVR